jgi:hypothetical protein
MVVLADSDVLITSWESNAASDCFGANARTASRRLNLAAAGRPRLPIVVLPFTNLSNYAGQQYFADGITGQSGGNRVRVGAHLSPIRISAHRPPSPCPLPRPPARG